MMRKYLFLLLVLFSVGELWAQDILATQEDTVARPGILEELRVEQDPRLDKMLKWHIEKNEKRAGMDGYRVEIFFSSRTDAKEQALDTKIDFLSKFPDHKVHIKFVAPNFRVRVGDFRTKNEAFKLYNQIKDDYPTAFVVPDIIEFPLLKPEKI